MPTLKHGTTTNVRVTKGDEVIFSGRCDVAHGEDGTWSLTPVPLPEEPPLYTVVHVPSLNQWQRWTRLDQPTGRNWVDNRAAWYSWEQVCALGTPEVLEPDSVKALRERLARIDAEREEFNVDVAYSALSEQIKELATLLDVDRTIEPERMLGGISGAVLAMRANERDLKAELDKANGGYDVEPAEPAPVEVTRPLGSQWRDRNGEVWTMQPNGCLRLDANRPYWNADHIEREYGPLTLVETGGQS
ncbi:MAG TPA: hypothetical protein VIP77_16315 [Jiangellaceae bacterium]